MAIEQGDAVKYNAIYMRVRGELRRLALTSYGYVLRREYNNFVYIDNGVRVDLVDTRDIEINYGKNKIFVRRNEPIEETETDE